MPKHTPTIFEFIEQLLVNRIKRKAKELEKERGYKHLVALNEFAQGYLDYKDWNHFILSLRKMLELFSKKYSHIDDFPKPPSNSLKNEIKYHLCDIEDIFEERFFKKKHEDILDELETILEKNGGWVRHDTTKALKHFYHNYYQVENTAFWEERAGDHPDPILATRIEIYRWLKEQFPDIDPDLGSGIAKRHSSDHDSFPWVAREILDAMLIPLLDADIEKAKIKTKYTNENPYHDPYNYGIRVTYTFFDEQIWLPKINPKSRALKHEIQGMANIYVSTSDVEVAATLHPKIRGEYPNYNISRRVKNPFVL